MKKYYIQPITAMQTLVRTSILCASGENTVQVNSNDPLNDTVIE